MTFENVGVDRKPLGDIGDDLLDIEKLSRGWRELVPSSWLAEARCRPAGRAKCPF
jgi:hypothetical protein